MPSGLGFVEPLAATPVSRLPEGDDWIYEVKLDGYRALVLKHPSRVEIRSRNDKALTAGYPGIVRAASALPASTALLDGEIVAVDPDGKPSFQALQNRGAHPRHTIVFYAFDLLHLDGADLRRQPLHARRDRLAALVAGTGVRLSPTLPGSAAQVVEAVRRLGLEGVIAKRARSTYAAGTRGDAWVKLKLDRQQEFVIGGYRPGPHGVDALLVGVYKDGGLRFAGKVRAGFTPRLRREVFTRLQPLRIAACPFVDLPSGRTSRWGGGVPPEEMAEMIWTGPSLLAQVRFVEWTDDDHLRHPAFLGLRDDKAAAGVVREE